LTLALFPTADGICLTAIRTGGGTWGTCNITADAASSGLFLLAPSTDQYDLFGILPDGATNVLAVNRDGQVIPLGLNDNNAFALFSQSGQIASVTFTGQDGTQHRVQLGA
jgi:hypothetical protein